MMKRLKSKNLARSYPRQSRCGKRNRISATAEFNGNNIALADLVAVFTEEAYKICKNRQIARLIALKSLQEYVTRNTDNIKIVL
jgi:hypothetical protein